MIVGSIKRESIKMRNRLNIAYMSLLLVSLISSCLLFLIVASESAAKSNNAERRDETLTEFTIIDNRVRTGHDKDVTPESHEQVMVAAAVASSGNRPPESGVTSKKSSSVDDSGNCVNDDERNVINGKSDESRDDKNKQFGKVPNVVENMNPEKIQTTEHEQPPQSAQSPTTAASVGDVERSVQQKAGIEIAAETANAADTIMEMEATQETLPDIPVNPAVITLGGKSPELVLDGPLSGDELDEINSNDNSTDDDLQPSASHPEEATVVATEPKTTKKETILQHEVSPDEPPPKIDDSGGGTKPPSCRQPDLSDTNQDSKDSSIPVLQDVLTPNTDIPVTPGDDTSSPSPASTPEVNLTVEENPIPVFSEWAQKQMEEAEKKLEKEVEHSSSMKKNSSTGNKPQPSKIRTKNYASPDCGAKIIASNSDSQNTGALLTSTKDEYMLSPCTNRIWFVVELCEAIQAEKIELANFELFSSSPKNFSVAVSNRFPTREWSNVGRFVANDQRNIQSFDLFPHLFGKFVRVDIHSHYNSEHFCPISLFRVYGTSEFEAFETENRLPADDMDDFDDEDVNEIGAGNANKHENNLFKSASDAVMSIVKKAAEALVKTNSNKTDSSATDNSKLQLNRQCTTLRHVFACEKCKGFTVNRTNYLLSCRHNHLANLLNIEMLRTHLLTSQICAKRFHLDTLGYDSLACSTHSSPFLDDRTSFILNAFPLEYLAALCHILVTDLQSKRHSRFGSTGPGTDSAMNLTIDQKPSSEQFVNIESRDRYPKKGKLAKLGTKEKQDEAVIVKNSQKKDKGKNRQEKQILRPAEKKAKDEGQLDIREQEIKMFPGDSSSSSSASIPSQDIPKSNIDEESPSNTAPDFNIFNVVGELGDVMEERFPHVTEKHTTSSERNDSEGTILKNNSEEASKSQEAIINSGSVDIEPTAWDNIEHLLTEQATSEGGNIGNVDGGGTSNQQIPQRVHSESVFLRLSNRVKALERNMSLSGQYLEELSRRYKKQVEELQHSFAKTLASIDEQNRRALEKEIILIQQNRNLKEQLDEISNRLNNWIIFGVSFFVFLMLQTIILWLRSHRENRRILKNFEESALSNRRRSTPMRKLLRRKSVEGVSGHPSPQHKIRRPSEEADRITGSYKNLLINDDEDIQNIEGYDEAKDTLSEIARKSSKVRNRKTSIGRRNGSLDPKVLMLGGQEPAPGDFIRSDGSSVLDSQDEDKLNLEDDYETYVPGTDLAYNEFMPDGPSGSPSNGKVQNGSKNSSKKSNKVRRLSSPNFLKSTFSRSGSTKKSPHSPTGWEWYRLRKSEHKTASVPSSENSSTTLTTPHSSQRISNGNGKSLKKSKSESPDLSIKLNGFGNGSSTPNSSISTDIMATGYNHTGSDDSIRASDTSLTTTGSILSNDRLQV